MHVALHRLPEMSEQSARRENVVAAPGEIRAGHALAHLDPADQCGREIDLVSQLVLGYPRGDPAPAQFRAEEGEQARARIEIS